MNRFLFSVLITACAWGTANFAEFSLDSQSTVPIIAEDVYEMIVMESPQETDRSYRQFFSLAKRFRK